MKIKLGFITNSSSVSFVGWGIRMPLIHELAYSGIPKKFFDEVFSLYLEHCEKQCIKKVSIKDFCDKAFARLSICGDEEINPWYFEFFKIVAQKYNLICDVDCLGREFIIAKSLLEIPDDMTGKEYREFIRKNLKDLGFNFEREKIQDIFTSIER